MKNHRNRLKINIMYYWSVINLVVTAWLFHVVHFARTGKPPQKRTKCSQEEIREELKKIAEEFKEKETPVEGPGSGE